MSATFKKSAANAWKRKPLIRREKPPPCSDCGCLDAPFGMADGRKLCRDCWEKDPSTQAMNFQRQRAAVGEID